VSLNLVLLRHAQAVPKDPIWPDHERRLTARGRRQARCVGNYLRSVGLIPELVISSTARRARATARRVIRRLPKPRPLRLLFPELYQADPQRTLDVLRCVPGSPTSLLVVGHNPCWDELASAIVHQTVTLPTAGLAWIVLPIDQWTELNLDVSGKLERLWSPEESC
jgi:phosphohistidine phosphatase